MWRLFYKCALRFVDFFVIKFITSHAIRAFSWVALILYLDRNLPYPSQRNEPCCEIFLCRKDLVRRWRRSCCPFNCIGSLVPAAGETASSNWNGLAFYVAWVD